MVKCRCENTAELGERKNVNLPGVVVDLPTITKKDEDDILLWGVPNKIDFIAASFVRKGSDLKVIRDLLGPQASKTIHIISKVSRTQPFTLNFHSMLFLVDVCELLYTKHLVHHSVQHYICAGMVTGQGRQCSVLLGRDPPAVQYDTVLYMASPG